MKQRRALIGMIVSVFMVLQSSGMLYAESLWRGTSAQESSFFVDKPAPKLAVNDIVVILIQEKTKATTDADTEAKIDDKIEGSVSNWFSLDNISSVMDMLKFDSPDVSSDLSETENLPKWGIEIKNKFKGEGETARNNQIIATVAARVVAVKPNGTVVLEGKRNVKVNKEMTVLTITGTARAKDVQADNTILSSVMADLQLAVDGKGVVASVNRRGLLSYIVSWIR